ncbi:MAG: hypothetical protein EA397_14845, partial [Deltaproteobacteria bacterium]
MTDDKVEFTMPAARTAAMVSLLLPGAGHMWIGMALGDDPKFEDLVGGLGLRAVLYFGLSLCCLPGGGNLLAAISAYRYVVMLDATLLAYEEPFDEEPFDEEPFDEEP